MRCPDGTTTVSVGGQQFIANEQGVVAVPAAFEQSLYAFGLLTVGKNVPDPEAVAGGPDGGEDEGEAEDDARPHAKRGRKSSVRE